MSFYYKPLLYILLLLAVGCSNGVIPQEYINFSGKYKVEESSNIYLAPIYYIVPVSICHNNLEDSLQNLRFPTTKQEREYTRIFTTFYLNNNTTNEYILEKRKDNYSAGSGVKYIVTLARKNDNNQSCIIKFTIKRKEIYREGILTMAAPQFNIENVIEFFKTANIIFEVSVLSKYSTKSTYASFDRILDLRNIEKLEGKTNITDLSLLTFL